MEQIEKFSKEIYNELIEEGMVEFKNTLENEENEDTTVQYWNIIDKLYARISKEEKYALLEMVKEEKINTITRLLRIIDGFGNIDYDGIEPKLYLGGQDTVGDVQELFLEYVDEIEEMEEQNKK